MTDSEEKKSVQVRIVRKRRPLGSALVDESRMKDILTAGKKSGLLSPFERKLEFLKNCAESVDSSS